MPDYAKMKNAELEALLKQRGLPHNGKKAEMVKRLEDNDASAAAPAPKKDEDEIDWDDEPAPDAKAAAAATASDATASIKDVTSSQNSTKQVGQGQNGDHSSIKQDVQLAADDAAAPAVEHKQEVDYSAGIALTTLDDEIAKRKARAKKFGLDEAADEGLKALERAKKFGGSELNDKLNQPLPERRERKRGRETEETGDRKRGRPGMRGGRRGSGRPDGERRTDAAPRQSGAGSWMSDADRAAAEKRKAKFATAT